MSDPAETAQTKQHNLRDWLELHALDQQTCLHIIDAIRCGAAETAVDRRNPHPRYQALDPDGAWAITIAAMRDFLPDHHNVIEETFEGCEKIAIVRSSKSRRALTIDNGPSKYPTILYNFNGDPSDPLVVAHEFGHALQIRASCGTFVSPVMREMCAFLAEEALLSYALDHNVSQYEALFERWRDDNQRYFGKSTGKLKAALANPRAIYEYGWNYPIARFLAHRMISTNFSQSSVWGVFRGESSLQAVLHKLGI